MIYRLIFVSDGAVAAGHVELASTFWQKGIGLIGRRVLAAGSGLWLPGVRSIHCIGMVFPIDVLFLDAEMRTTKAISRVTPGRICFAPQSTRHCIELSAGALNERQLTEIAGCWTLAPVI